MNSRDLIVSESLKVFIVIPVFNHGKTLREVVVRAVKTGAQVMVVDDGSTDGGLETLSGLEVITIRHPENQGKGAAILTAAREAERLGMTHIVTLDADGQHNPADFSLFLPLIRENPQALVVGTRIFDKKASPLLSRFGRSFSNFWFRVQTSSSIKDAQSGFRAYPVGVLTWLKLNDKRFSFEVEVLVKAAWAGIEIKEVDISVQYPPSRERVSHFHLIKDNLALGLLNTRLTMRAVLPLPHKQFIPTENGLENISIFHPLKSLRILSKNTSPALLAVSAGMGVLIGTLPLVGFWTLTVLIAANYFGLSKIAALSSNQLCNHPVVPALCIELGYFFRHGRFLTEFSLNTLGYQGLERIFEWLIGSLVLAPVFGLITGGLIYILAWSIAKGKIVERRS
jgi:glycosyltransferase involved in cell wall biosynthesis